MTPRDSAGNVFIRLVSPGNSEVLVTRATSRAEEDPSARHHPWIYWILMCFSTACRTSQLLTCIPLLALKADPIVPSYQWVRSVCPAPLQDAFPQARTLSSDEEEVVREMAAALQTMRRRETVVLDAMLSRKTPVAPEDEDLKPVLVNLERETRRKGCRERHRRRDRRRRNRRQCHSTKCTCDCCARAQECSQALACELLSGGAGVKPKNPWVVDARRLEGRLQAPAGAAQPRTRTLRPLRRPSEKKQRTRRNRKSSK